MTTAEILKQLESAKSEAEMLTLAEKLGVTRAFLNAGSVVDLAVKSPAKTNASKHPAKAKSGFTYLATKLKQPGKKVRRRAVGA